MDFVLAVALGRLGLLLGVLLTLLLDPHGFFLPGFWSIVSAILLGLTLLSIGFLALLRFMWRSGKEEVDMEDGTEQLFYRDIDPAMGSVYSLELLMTSRREVYFHFPNAADRDAVCEQLRTVISPALVIESSGPITPKLPSQKWSHFSKPTFPNEVFATEAAYDRAASRAMTELMMPKTPPAPEAPPAPRPLRKPYTRKLKDPSQ